MVLPSLITLCGVLFSMFVTVSPTIYTDTGCACATTKTTVTTPNASSTITTGCSFKTDWTGQTTEWCLSDQTTGVCGTFETGFGYLDSCAQAAITSVTFAPPPQIEWDQDSTTFYTGQTLNVSWNTQNIGSDEFIRIWYQGVNQRVLTSGSGVNSTSKFFSVRLSDSNNAPTTGKVPLNLNLPSTASISALSPQNISVIQSKITTAFVYDGSRQLVTGQTAVCDDRNLSLTWRGLGQAQVGLASTYIRSSFGGGSAIAGTLSNLPALGNMTVNYTLPRSFTPSTFGGVTYYAVITVQEPGQNAYTANSASFSLAAAPSQTPTSSGTPTPSKTGTSSITSTPSPTPTPSVTPSPTACPSNTPTPTSSITSTISPTPSTTETARPSLDLNAITVAAANAAKEQQNTVTAGIVGSIGGIIIIFGTIKYFLTKKQMAMRRNRMKLSARYARDADKLYGIQRTPVDPIPTSSAHVEAVVMYSLKHPQTNKSRTEKV